MKSRFLTNYTETSFLATIQANLRTCVAFYFTVSFIKKAGLVLLASDIKAALERGAKGMLVTSTYQVNGVLIFTSEPSKDTQYGTYTYDVNKKKLTYLFDGNWRPVNASVIIHNPVTITLIVDYQEVGTNIYTMKKIDW